MAVNISGSSDLDYGIFESIRHSMFQAISITSTGYSSADFSQWPVFSQFVLASDDHRGQCWIYWWRTQGLIRIAFELAKRGS